MSAMMKKHLVESVVPLLIELKHMLQVKTRCVCCMQQRQYSLCYGCVWMVCCEVCFVKEHLAESVVQLLIELKHMPQV